jgi:hypothetical protein
MVTFSFFHFTHLPVLLRSLLYFLNPNGLADSQGGPFADQKTFQAWFSNPMDKAIETGDVMDKETRETVAKLHTVLRPYLLRRLKADVDKEMPRKVGDHMLCGFLFEVLTPSIVIVSSSTLFTVACPSARSVFFILFLQLTLGSPNNLIVYSGFCTTSF